ncbi:MAG: hypothetical protein H6742_01625 [Alphaproteobacteria bacterium]|nr:hypothetical protein [Alphaproteobacteria bacterium]
MSPRTLLTLAPLPVLLLACGDKDGGDGDGDGSESVCIDDDLGSEVAQPLATGETDGDDYQGSSCNGEEVGDDGQDWGWTWTAPATAGYTFNTFGSEFDTILYILDGDCNGEVIACNNDASADNTASQIYIELQEGQQVVLIVDGYDAYEYGDIQVEVLQDL